MKEAWEREAVLKNSSLPTVWIHVSKASFDLSTYTRVTYVYRPTNRLDGSNSKYVVYSPPWSVAYPLPLLLHEQRLTKK